MARPQISSKLRSALKSRKIGKIGLVKPAAARKLVSRHRKQGKTGVPPKGSTQQAQTAYYRAYMANKRAKVSAKAKPTKPINKEAAAKAYLDKRYKEKYPNEPWKWNPHAKKAHFKRDAKGLFWSTSKGKPKLIDGKKVYATADQAKELQRAHLNKINAAKMKKLVPGPVEPGGASGVKIKRSKNTYASSQYSHDEKKLNQLAEGLAIGDNPGYSTFKTSGGLGSKIRGKYKKSNRAADAKFEREFLKKYGKRKG